MSTKREKYAEKRIDINDFEKNLNRVLSESKDALVAVMQSYLQRKVPNYKTTYNL